MHGWGAVDFRICLAPKDHGYSISSQRYDVYTHLAQLDNLDFTLSRTLFISKTKSKHFQPEKKFRKLLPEVVRISISSISCSFKANL